MSTSCSSVILSHTSHRARNKPLISAPSLPYKQVFVQNKIGKVAIVTIEINKMKNIDSFKVVWNVENFVCHFCYIFIYQANKSTDHFNTKKYIPHHA